MAIDKDLLPFAKRYGFEPIQVPFQTNTIDQILRVEMWNAFYIFIHKKLEDCQSYSEKQYRAINKILWVHYFKKPLDDFARYDSEFKNFIKNYIEKIIWYKVYELFEFILAHIEDERLYDYNGFSAYLNSKLRSSNSAYTLVGNRFVPITNEAEVNEIKITQSLVGEYGLSGVHEHLNAAIELLSQKPNPDYRNSIKESISMVEVISRIIEPTENTLGKALNKLEKNQKINSTLKIGFEKLYAYTNDKNGIRHALMDEKSVELEDARFFLISCSAFTNYLIEKAKKENVIG